MPLNIIRNDISKVKADAIVNTANANVAVGAGVDQAIYEAAGFDELLAERAKIGPMKPGQAAATPAFALDAKYIIHTIGPAWQGGNYHERETVASCYRESLRIADELHCESVAFPLISTGTFGFPKDEALRIAVNEISSFLFTHDMTVYMVVYDKEAFVISGKAFPDIKEFIEEEDVKPPESSYLRRRRRMQQIASSKLDLPLSYARREDVPASIDMEEEFLPDAATGPELAGPEVGMAELDMAELDMDQPDMDQPELADISYSENVSLPEAYFTGNYEGLDKKLDEIIKRRAKTFQQMLFQWIDRKGMTDPEVYKKANVDRKLFSKIRSKEDYLPSKKTVIAFAIALELNLDQTIDLLRRAGYALSPSSEFDLIIEYCINHKIYNIHKINILLFDRTDQILVGC